VDAAYQATRYERHARGMAGGQWPDFRSIALQPTDEQWTSMYAWCHGAPGIGLARLSMLADHPASSALPTLHSDLELAVRDTVRLGFTGNHSLCHGMLGNYALILGATRTTHTALTSADHDTIASHVLESIAHRGVQCGIPRGIETPGLLTGLAGIGLGLLRMGGHEVVDVLTLTLPRITTP